MPNVTRKDGSVGYVWEQFAEGNQAALTHGTYSPVMVAAKADELRPQVTGAAPWTAAPEFAGTLELYCRTLATALLGLEHIAQGDRRRRATAQYRTVSSNR